MTGGSDATEAARKSCVYTVRSPISHGRLVMRKFMGDILQGQSRPHHGQHPLAVQDQAADQMFATLLVYYTSSQGIVYDIPCMGIALTAFHW